MYYDSYSLMHHGVKGMKWGERKDLLLGVNPMIQMLRQKHYDRNRYNKNLPKNSNEAKKMGYKQLSEKMSAMHQNKTEGGVANKKFVSKDGKKEIVFMNSGKKEHANNYAEDMGTYNFANPNNNKIGHAILDVVPYYLWGNTPNENTTAYTRVKSSIVQFGKASIGDLDSRTIEKGRKFLA